MALNETEITLVVVASCGVVIVAVFIACLLIFCCFRRGREKKRLREASFRSRSGLQERGASFNDYQRRAFRPPPPYTESITYKTDLESRSDVSERIYSDPYERRKFPLPILDYERIRGERNYGFHPSLDRGRDTLKDDRPSVNLRENTVYIPYALRFIEEYSSEKMFPEQYYPRLSIKELDDNASIDDEVKYKPTNPKTGLPRYELEYL